MEFGTFMENEKRKYNNKLMMSIQIINALLGALVALLCVVIYSSIEDGTIKSIAITVIIIIGIVCFFEIYKSLYLDKKYDDRSNITFIELVNEDNDVVKRWNIEDKISFVIGKSTMDEKVFIDLNSSVYSTLIEDKHAVLNYANGMWYIEDISINSGISIQKRDDDIKYRIVKESPCEIKRGDILYISKVKLLLK